MSVCPHCFNPTPLLNGVWVCEPCWKKWPIGPAMRQYLPERVGYDRDAWDGLVELLSDEEEQ